MGILLDLVTSLKDHQESTNSVPTAEMPQEGSELFLEMNQSPADEAKKEQVDETLDFDGDPHSILILILFSVFRSFFLYLATYSSIHV